MSIHPAAWRSIAFALACALAGCSDFSQHRIGGVREIDNLAEGPPRPAPGLSIPNPPTTARAPQEDAVKQATLGPERAGDVNPQMNVQALRILHQRAAKSVADLDSYIFRMRRREVVEGRKNPEEVIRVAVRREPYSVHLKWLGPEAKGRETVYVKGKFNDEMQILLAAGDILPLSPAGIRWSIAPNDARARARSRYPITGTGLASLVERFGAIVSAMEKGDSRDAAMKYLGPVNRPEFDAKVEGVQQTLAPKSDPNMPKGGHRWWFFDAASGLPVLIIAHDPDGEVEYYCHDHIQATRFTDDDFNPDKLWKK